MLDKLDVYIAHCDAVVHLSGSMTGAEPGARELRALLAKYPDLTGTLPPLGEALKNGAAVSYTQWEAWLALYHDKLLLIAKAAETAERGPTYAPTDTSRAAQAAHLARLEAVSCFPGCEFTSPDNLGISNYSAAVRKLELDVLDSDAATAFLLERTQDDRDRSANDASLARALAAELSGLALGLEQAGAYIVAERIGFARYLALWREKCETVLNWFDKDLMSYNHDVGLATTWVTSVERLTPEGRRLLERLAYFAPEPISDTLLNIAIPGETADSDLRKARANLFDYSLAGERGRRQDAGGGICGAPSGARFHQAEHAGRASARGTERSARLGERGLHG